MSRNYRGGPPVRTLGDPARILALDVLLQVSEEGAFANLTLPKALREMQRKDSRFSFRDSAFASEVVYGTLRWQGYLDTVLASYCTRPLASLDTVVLELLRMGAYQLLFMRVPDHAAVSETVDIARSRTHEGGAKLVNAVLRAITRADENEIESIFAQLPGDEQIAARTSHPVWMVRSVREALVKHGGDGDDVEVALLANNETPEVNLVARPHLISTNELASEVEDILDRETSRSDLSPYAVVIEGGDPGALPSVRSGEAAVQDQGSQFAAILLAEAPIDGSDEKWLDLCAGPGGKTALLAALAPEGTSILANEVSAKRAGLVVRSVRALDNVSVQTGDGRHIGNAGQFDRVLIDAPCSGIGALRRRPESRWRHHEEDLEQLLPLQKSLFDAGIEAARSGGLIAWVTCTPQVEETLDQVDMAMSRGDVELLDIRSLAHIAAPKVFDAPALDSPDDSLVSRTIQLWPHVHGSDAMFIALLRKR